MMTNWLWIYLSQIRRYGASKILGSRVWPSLYKFFEIQLFSNLMLRFWQLLLPWSLRSGEVRENQGILRSQGKSGKNQKIGESRRIAKVNKDTDKKIPNCRMQTAYDSSEFFLLTSLVDCFYLHFLICSTTFFSSVIASDWKLTLVFHVNRTVRENDSFYPGKSGKMNSAE